MEGAPWGWERSGPLPAPRTRQVGWMGPWEPHFRVPHLSSGGTEEPGGPRTHGMGCPPHPSPVHLPEVRFIQTLVCCCD